MKRELKLFIFLEFLIWALTGIIMVLLGCQYANLEFAVFMLAEVLVLLLGTVANAVNLALLSACRTSASA